MANEYNFFEQKDITDNATEIITNYFKSLGFTVINVEQDRRQQIDDVDLFVIHAEPGKFPQRFKIEIKADTTTTSNYFAEYISNDQTGSLGCWYQTKSDAICYYFTETRELHVFETKPAQEWLRNNEHRLKSVEVKTRGMLNYSSFGYLVNKKEFQKEVKTQIIQL